MTTQVFSSELLSSQRDGTGESVEKSAPTSAGDAGLQSTASKSDVTTADARLSSRVRELKPSGIRKFFDMASNLKGRVYSLSIGEPDFVTPWSIREAGIYALERGYTHYTGNQGLLELRSEICRYLEERFSLRYEPNHECMVTVGGSEAIDACMRSLLNPGDEVIIPEPCFVAYDACARLAGAVPVPVALRAEDDFRLKPKQLAGAISERTRMLILAFPNNPTGAMMERRDLEALLPVLQRYPEITILSDELYAELVYGGKEFCSPAVFPELRERTVLIGGFSKAFAMTGWRIGYACAAPEIIAAMNKIHQYAIMSAPTNAQYAAIEALKNCRADVERMREAYDERRRYLYKGLRQLGIPVFEPFGAFYIYPDISAYGLTSIEFCERFLTEKQVAIVPGDAFGACGEGFVRISYASSMETIREALNRLGDFLQPLKS